MRLNAHLQGYAESRKKRQRFFSLFMEIWLWSLLCEGEALEELISVSRSHSHFQVKPLVSTLELEEPVGILGNFGQILRTVEKPLKYWNKCSSFFPPRVNWSSSCYTNAFLFLINRVKLSQVVERDDPGSLRRKFPFLGASSKQLKSSMLGMSEFILC